MANKTFEFVGRLTLGKESEKFKPYEEKISEKKWKTTTLKFNVKAGDNTHFVEVKGGCWEDGHGDLFTFSKGSTDANGKKIKGEKLTIPFKDRKLQENIDKVAEFKKCVIDIEKYGYRFKLKKALEKLESEDLTQEDVDTLKIEELTLELDVKSKKEILTKALEVSNKKRKEFLAECDYAEYLHKLISSGKINDKNFIVKGEEVVSEWKGKTYTNMMVNKIYLADEKAETSSTAQLEVFFNKDSLDSNSFEEKKKHYINAYIRTYDNNRKEEIPSPIMLVLDCTKDEENEKNKKLNETFRKQFIVEDDSWKQLGVKIKVLNGSQKVDITEDMLTDFQKEMLELDPDFINEIRRDLGGDIYGEKIQENIIINVSKGYSKGRKDTVYTDDDFVIKPIELKVDEAKEEEKDDLFNDSDDLDLDFDEE